jgi:hypothetical protein
MECYYSRSRLIGLALLNTLMMATAWVCLFSPNIVAVMSGWAGIVLCSLAYIGLVKGFCRSGPQVIISDAGIEDRRCAAGLIPWMDIDAVSVGSVASTRFLCLHLREPEKYLGSFPRAAGLPARSSGRWVSVILLLGSLGLLHPSPKW